MRIIGYRGTPADIWIHGASVGELAAIRPFVEEWARRAPSLSFLVTTTTATGLHSTTGWDVDRLQAGFAPADSLGLIARFLKRHCIKVYVGTENELWPNRMISCGTNGVRIAIIGGRMSKGSARVWTRFAAVTRAMMRSVKVIVPQNAQSRSRYRSLGISPEVLLQPFDLKSLYSPTTEDLPNEMKALVRPSTFLAASTHEGEDETVLTAYKHAKDHRPDLRLIIAPRHVERGDDLRALCHQQNLSVSQRSKGHTAGEGEVHVADTMGEMHHWYRACHAAFLGGSLVQKGGHTPYPPANYGCAISYGPSVENFQNAFDKLCAEGGAVAVRGAADLADFMIKAPEGLAQNARAALPPADLDSLFEILGPRLPAL